jgi:hypothetical protein
VKLTAQLYNDADYVRIFESGNDYGIADVNLPHGIKGDRRHAEFALNKLGLLPKRWRAMEWGWQSTISK